MTGQKTAVVVGGGTGIGLGCARALAESGYTLVIAGRRQEVLRQAAADWPAANPVHCGRVDVACREAVDELINWVESSVGPINVLVNAAGINIPNRTMAAMKPDEWDKIVAVNTTGAYNLMQAVLPAMRARGDGLIINISSIAGKRATPLGGVAYNATKFAMGALSTSVGLEESTHGIRVTSICPGEVNTPILDLRPNPVSDADRARMLQPEDLGAVVAMLANLPSHVHVPELIVKPLSQAYA